MELTASLGMRSCNWTARKPSGTVCRVTCATTTALIKAYVTRGFVLDVLTQSLTLVLSSTPTSNSIHAALLTVLFY